MPESSSRLRLGRGRLYVGAPALLSASQVANETITRWLTLPTFALNALENLCYDVRLLCTRLHNSTYRPRF